MDDCIAPEIAKVVGDKNTYYAPKWRRCSKMADKADCWARKVFTKEMFLNEVLNVLNEIGSERHSSSS
jgi:hypothetical protein